MTYNYSVEALKTPTEPNPLGVAVNEAVLALADEQLGNRNYDQVFDLWETQGAITDPAVRQRAVAIITSPNGYRFRFDSYPDQHISRLFGKVHGVSYPGETVRGRFADRPDLSQELAHGVMYWLDNTHGQVRDHRGRDHDSREEYQGLIRQLLPIVEEETADILWQYATIRDLESYQNSDLASGYRPLEVIIGDKEMPSKYKQSALESWCRNAVHEEVHRFSPRAPHERATDQMSDILQIMTYSYENDREGYDEIIRVIEDNLPPGIAYVKDIKPGMYIGISSVADAIGDIELRNRFLLRHGRAPVVAQTAVGAEVQPDPGVGELLRPETGVIVGSTAEDGETSLSLNVQSEYFEAIRAGRKTIEGRLAKTKYSNLRPGNRITITDDGSGEQLVMEVESMHIYYGFSAAFSRRERFQDAVPGASSAEEALRVYEQFYSLDKQAAEGVIFLELKPIPARP